MNHFSILTNHRINDGMKIFSPLSLLLLLACALAAPSSSSVFYCRRFKGDCKQRRDYICCRDENTANASVAKETKEVTEEVVDDVQEQTTQPYSSTTVEDIHRDKIQVSLQLCMISL